MRETIFRRVNSPKDPPQDTQAAIKEVQERRKRTRKG